MREIAGMWVPDGDPADYIANTELKDGFPSYQYSRFAEAVNVCGERKGIAVDAGAHIGLFSAHMARHFKWVHAFEPVRSNFECLEANWKRFRKKGAPAPNVTLYRMGLSNQAGETEIVRHGGKSYSWRVEPGSQAEDITAREKIKVRTLDSFFLSDIDFVKIDIDGHELAAVEGMAQTLLRCRPVVLIEEKFDRDRKASKFLKRLGMRMVWQQKHDYLWQFKEQAPAD